MLSVLNILHSKSPRTKLAAISVMAILAFMFLAIPCTPSSAEATNKPIEVREEQVKAVYLYNFLHFISWPELLNTPRKGEPTPIAVLGDSPIHDALDELAKALDPLTKTTITVKHYSDLSKIPNPLECDILFIGASESDHLTEIINTLGDQPILTVSDSSTFLEKGGMILLVEQDGKIRYQINRSALEKAHLRANSQLLKSSL